MTKMKRPEAESLLESWGAERVGFNRVRSGVVVESIHVPTSPRRKGGLIANLKRQTGWRHYKFD